MIIESLRELSFLSVCIRLLVAMIAGGVIGFERGLKGRAAGFRTYTLVAIGSALTVILSQYMTVMLELEFQKQIEVLGIKVDMARFAAQAIGGIGFLGAGTILVSDGHTITGLTTAAGLWVSACMGIAAGAAFFECVAISFLLTLICIVFLPKMEPGFLKSYRKLIVQVDFNTLDVLGMLIEKFKSENIIIRETELNREKRNGEKYFSAIFSLNLGRKRDHSEILASLAMIKGVNSVMKV